MDDRANRRIRGFGTTIFTEMSRLAAEHGAVNLGQGFPDFEGPDFVKDAAKTAIDGGLNRYAEHFQRGPVPVDRFGPNGDGSRLAGPRP
jgi:aspartate/methionine/tyrosine aminotransferase